MKREAFCSVVQMAAADSNEFRGTKGVASWKACILIPARTRSFFFLLEKNGDTFCIPGWNVRSAHFLHSKPMMKSEKDQGIYWK